MKNYNKVDIRILVGMFLAAFINFNKPFYGSLFLLFFELSILHIIYSNPKLIKQRVSTAFNKNQLIAPTAFVLLATISTLILLMSNASNTQQILGIIRYFSIIAHIFFTLTLSVYFLTQEQNRKIFTPLPASIITVVIFIFIDYHFNPYSVMFSEPNRVIVAYNIRYLGYIAMLGCLYCAIKMLQCRIMSKKHLWISIVFSINFSLLIWLGGRGAIVAFIFSFLVSLIVINQNSLDKYKHLTAILALIALSYLISIPLSVFPWNGPNRFMFLSQVHDASINQVSSGRIALWLESISLIIQKPLFGYGPEAHVFETKIGFLQPHNFLLQSLLEFGLLGTAPILLMLYYITKSAIINALIDSTANNLYACGLIIAIISHSFYDGTLYHAPPLLIMCIASSYVLSVTLKRNIPLTNHQIANVAKNET
ncbi:O-antigen ligase family protein [Vibrio sp. PNB23_22_6]